MGTTLCHQALSANLAHQSSWPTPESNERVQDCDESPRSCLIPLQNHWLSKTTLMQTQAKSCSLPTPLLQTEDYQQITLVEPSELEWNLDSASVWVHGIPSIASPHNPSNYRKQIGKVLPGVACIFCVDMENKWTAGEVIKLETDGNGGVLVNREPRWHSERWLWWCHSRPQGDVGGQMNICS